MAEMEKILLGSDLDGIEKESDPVSTFIFFICLFLTGTLYAFPNSFAVEPQISLRGKLAEGAIAMGFVSKEMCSCLFVENNPREYCDDYIMLDGLENINFKVQVDMKKKSVRASTSFVIVKKAQYFDEKRGCSQTQ